MDILVEVGADISIRVSDSNLVLSVSRRKCSGYSWQVVFRFVRFHWVQTYSLGLF